MFITNDSLTIAFVESVQMVKEFHEVFGHPVGQTPSISLSERRAAERLTYLTEELLEGTQAALAGDRVAVIDALADAIYFACGNLVESGMVDRDGLQRVIGEILDHEEFDGVMERMQLMADELGWERYMRNVFIGSTQEVSENHMRSVDSQAEEADVEVVPCSAGLAAAYLSMLAVVLDTDPLDVMREVHRSNMSKLLPAELDSENACRVFMTNNGCKVDPEELRFERLDDMRWIAKHMSTNKVIKNPLFSEPNLKSIA